MESDKGPDIVRKGIQQTIQLLCGQDMAEKKVLIPAVFKWAYSKVV